jgi:60 kDa SS-A/Ro ribonucleoprotein
MREWNLFRARNPNARLVLIDLQPSPTMQTVDRPDVLNIGGFSDQVFSVIAEFAAGRLIGDEWVAQIDAIAV